MLDVLAVHGGENRGLARLVEALAADGFGTRTVARVAEVEHAARAIPADSLLFDATEAPLDVVARLRREHPAQVLIAWSATGASVVIANLLDAGADEVVHAAMGDREQVARVAAALRRAGKPVGTQTALGALRLDPLHGEATWAGRDLMLTRREREVLEVLAEHPGRTVRREVLYRRVWGYAMPRGERSVDVNVKRLRRKLAATAGPDLQVKTQPGVGYRLELAPDPVREPVTTL